MYDGDITPDIKLAISLLKRCEVRTIVPTRIWEQFRELNTADYGGEHTTTYRGIVFFHTNSEEFLSFMNNVVGLYITQVNNEEGSSLRQIWK